MSAAAALLDVGRDVTCYEPAAIMGERSVGSTRIFRLAHADPDLVRLAQQAREGFDKWAKDAGRLMLIGGGCVITGSDMADRATAMAKADAAYELVGASSGRLRLPVVEEPAAALVDVGGGWYTSMPFATSSPHEPVRPMHGPGLRAGHHRHRDRRRDERFRQG